MFGSIRQLVGLSVSKEDEFEEKVARGMKYMSHAGHLVQSKGELRIANHLYGLGIPYIYDTPISINEELVRPDFILPEQRLIIEFRGMDTEEYNEKFERKFDIYANSNFEVMIISPDGLDEFERMEIANE